MDLDKRYPYIRAWWENFGASNDVIKSDQQLAMEKNAPYESLFWNNKEQRWVLLEDITMGDKRVELENRATEIYNAACQETL